MNEESLLDLISHANQRMNEKETGGIIISNETFEKHKKFLSGYRITDCPKSRVASCDGLKLVYIK